jgi:hypothetical protein
LPAAYAVTRNLWPALNWGPPLLFWEKKKHKMTLRAQLAIFAVVAMFFGAGSVHVKDTQPIGDNEYMFVHCGQYGDGDV